MYVCTKPSIGLEHINQKRRAIPHCVLVIHHFASRVQRDEPGSSVYLLKATVRARSSCQRTAAAAPTC